jgi:hypothetical protein
VQECSSNNNRPRVLQSRLCFRQQVATTKVALVGLASIWLILVGLGVYLRGRVRERCRVTAIIVASAQAPATAHPHVRVHSCASTHISGSLNRCPLTRTHARAQPASSDARTRAHMLTCACSRAGTESMVLSPATSSLAVYACRAPSVRWHTPSERAAICCIQAHMLTQTCVGARMARLHASVCI